MHERGFESNSCWVNDQGGVSSQRQPRFQGPLGWSLHLFARTAHSAYSLCSAPLCYVCFARSLHSRARSLTSLTPLWDSWNSWICVHAVNAFDGKTCIFGRHSKHVLKWWKELVGADGKIDIMTENYDLSCNYMKAPERPHSSTVAKKIPNCSFCLSEYRWPLESASKNFSNMWTDFLMIRSRWLN